MFWEGSFLFPRNLTFNSLLPEAEGVIHRHLHETARNGCFECLFSAVAIECCSWLYLAGRVVPGGCYYRRSGAPAALVILCMNLTCASAEVLGGACM